MFALAALVLLASSTFRAEDLLSPGTMVCTCSPTSTETAPVQEVVAPAPRLPTRWGIAAGAASLALFGGSYAAHVRSNSLAGSLGDGTLASGRVGGSSTWNAASTAMLVSGAALAGFSAAFFVLRF